MIYLKYGSSTSELTTSRTSQVPLRVKNLPAMQETQGIWVQSLGQEDPRRRAWQPTPVFLTGESHRQRILGGLSPQSCRVGYN